VHLFWQKGYEQITMADPVAATGVSRYGFIPNLGTNMTCF
jgi:hypothetical protein